MQQLTWRAADELVERVRLAARHEGRSMNDYISAVLDAATNPDSAASDARRSATRYLRRPRKE